MLKLVLWLLIEDILQCCSGPEVMAVLGIAGHALMQPLVGIWKSYSGPETRAVQKLFSNSLKEIIEEEQMR